MEEEGDVEGEVEAEREEGEVVEGGIEGVEEGGCGVVSRSDGSALSLESKASRLEAAGEERKDCLSTSER